MRDLYDVLGVSRTATPKEIKKAYRELARNLHPDRSDAPDAEARFKEVNAANEVLSDPERRKLYDTYGAASLSNGFNPEAAASQGFAGGAGGRGFPQGFGQGMDMDDLLSNLFSQGGIPRGPRPIRANLQLDFRTAVLGGERTLTLGDGHTMKIRIPPGVRDQGVLRLRGRGPRGADVELHLSVATDPEFTRVDNDLHLTVPVTIGQALLGSQIPIPTLTGTVKLSVPACSQNGARLRVRGRGVQHKGGTGDLYVTLEVRLPTTLDDETRRAVEVLERAYADSVPA